MLTAVRLLGLINRGSSAYLVSFHSARLYLILGGGRFTGCDSHGCDGFRVTGVDNSSTLISLCRTRIPDREWIIADMRSLALGALAWDSFFHLRHEDQRTMFRIFAGHSARAPLLMFNAGFSHGEELSRVHAEGFRKVHLGDNAKDSVGVVIPWLFTGPLLFCALDRWR